MLMDVLPVFLLVALAAVILLAPGSDAASISLPWRLLDLVRRPLGGPRCGGAGPFAVNGAVLCPARVTVLLRLLCLLSALVALASELRLLLFHHAHAQAAAVAAVVVLRVAQVGLLFLQLIERMNNVKYISIVGQYFKILIEFQFSSHKN
jgi:hypothetical protein